MPSFSVFEGLKNELTNENIFLSCLQTLGCWFFGADASKDAPKSLLTGVLKKSKF